MNHRRGAARPWILLSVLALAVAVLVVDLRGRFGLDRVVTVTGMEDCRVIPGPAGPEDLQIDPATGFAWIAATDRRTPGARGGIWRLDLRDRESRPVRIEHTGPADFRPHGLSLLRDGDRLRLFVVNHPANGHAVEVFDLVDRRAIHRATLTGEQLVSPNDVAAMPGGAFYVTNDHGAPQGLPRAVERLLGLRLGTLAYHDGRRFSTAGDDFSFANGVRVTPDGSVAVTETLSGTLLFLDREPRSGRVRPHEYMDLDSGLDNISRAGDGSLWIAAHPDLLAFLRHADDADAPSPTQVWRIERDRFGTSADLVVADDGSRFSGGSVAAAWGDQLLVGTVFDAQLLRCDLPGRFAVGNIDSRRPAARGEGPASGSAGPGSAAGGEGVAAEAGAG